MKKFIISVVFCLAMSGFAFAQSRLPELEKIKQIKLLESTREDVKRIFADYNLEFFNEKRHLEQFSSPNAEIEVRYSSGKCSDDWGEDWNVPEWKVRLIYIALTNPVKVEDFSNDLSKYKRERIFANIKDTYTYHNKPSGIGFNVNENGIYAITLIPSKENYSLLCETKQVRKYYASKSWFSDKLKDRWKEPSRIANVIELNLSKEEITVECKAKILPQTQPVSDDAKITVKTRAESAFPTDVIIYYYVVSGGKIIGNGANVIWDLNSVSPGKYIITANADIGCGICGKAITKEVFVKERSDCQPK